MRSADSPVHVAAKGGTLCSYTRCLVLLLHFSFACLARNAQVLVTVKNALRSYYKSGRVVSREAFKDLARKFTSSVLEAQTTKTEREYQHSVAKYNRRLQAYKEAKRANTHAGLPRPKPPQRPLLRFSDQTGPKIRAYVDKWFAKRKTGTPHHLVYLFHSRQLRRKSFSSVPTVPIRDSCAERRNMSAALFTSLFVCLVCDYSNQGITGNRTLCADGCFFSV